MDGAGSGLKALENKCVAACQKYGWLSPKGTPNYRLIYSHPTTFTKHAPFMLLGINPGGSAKFADEHPAELPYSHVGYSAYLDEQWAGGVPGTYRLQMSAQRVAAVINGDTSTAQSLLRKSPTGNIVPFRSPRFTDKDLPRALRDEGIDIGKALIRQVDPKILVLLGGSELLFAAAVSAFSGHATVFPAVECGSKQMYREAVVEEGSTQNRVFALPQRALSQALEILAQRASELDLRVPS